MPLAQDTIAEQIRARISQFTSGERKAGHVLLANYPMAGLETVADFAARAGVSGPTILRFVARLGFDGYAAFQRALKDELNAQLQSPLAKSAPSRRRAGNGDERVETFADAIVDNITETFRHLPPGEFGAVVDLLADTRRALHLLGGRFTDPLARYMSAHLRVLRSGVTHVAGQADNWRDQLIDMGRRDVLILFDVRRYQDDLHVLAKEAVARNVTIILMTDQWLSPIASHANHILSARIPVPSNWDSNAALMALVEALLAQVTERVWPAAKRRIEALEHLRPPGRN